MVLRNACRTDSYVRIRDTLYVSKLTKGPINLFVSLRLIVFEQYFVYHLICPNYLRFLRSKSEILFPSPLVAAMFRKSGMLDRSVTHDAFHTSKSAARNYRNDHKYRADVHCELFR